MTACNNSGLWNEAGASLDFSIDPAYYQTTWFYAACVAAFLAMLTAAHWLRVRYLQRQFDINLMGTVWCSRAAWPHMKSAGYGRIVNITSSSMTGFANQAAPGAFLYDTTLSGHSNAGHSSTDFLGPVPWKKSAGALHNLLEYMKTL